MACKKKNTTPVRLYFYRGCVTGGVAYEIGPADVPAFLAHRLKAAGVAGETPEPPAPKTPEPPASETPEPPVDGEKKPAKKSTKKDINKE